MIKNNNNLMVHSTQNEYENHNVEEVRHKWTCTFWVYVYETPGNKN